MKLVKIRYPNSKKFKEAWGILRASFPFNERRGLNAQIKIMKNKLYDLFLVYDSKELVGIIAYWNFHSFLFIEHLAIKNKFRNHGRGTELLRNHIIKKNKKAVLEAEKLKNRISIKRIKFYKKVGFKLNRHNYIQPPYDKSKKPVPMFLMSFPDKLSNINFLDIRKKIYTKVYGIKDSFPK